MATPHFAIETRNLRVEEIGTQLRSIKEVPCMITLYDRVMKMDTLGEIWALIQGLEIGTYLNDEQRSK